MLKIQHPGAIAREREKKVSSWETVRTVRYASGVEYQVLIGALPHGHLQSAISANRRFTLAKAGDDLVLSFDDAQAPIVDFAAGDRPTQESDNLQVLDPCLFVPTAKVEVSHGGESGETAEEDGHLVTRFADGTRVSLHAHGSHAHVEATRDDAPVKAFFNGNDNTLYVFGSLA